MKEFQALIDILVRLLGPEGCPWDKKQTLKSMRHSLLEETYEIIEAIDLEDDLALKEELGDLFFNAIFLSKMAEKEDRFTIEDVLKGIAEKLIRRHPHIFGEERLDTPEEVLKKWNEIKRQEKKQTEKKSLLDSIPKDLPVLARAQKIIKNAAGTDFFSSLSVKPSSEEERAGELLWNVVHEMAKQEIQAEQALRNWLAHIEKEFRKWEEKGAAEI